MVLPLSSSSDAESGKFKKQSGTSRGHGAGDAAVGGGGANHGDGYDSGEPTSSLKSFVDIVRLSVSGRRVVGDRGVVCFYFVRSL